MTKRLFDVACAVVGLILTAPLLACAALGIRLASRGPLLHRARRAGLHGRPFTMYKLRTMHLTAGGGWSRVTAADDRRTFPVGRLLRRTKIDELPQLVNVLVGQMSIVGPRPEDPDIVARYYTPRHLETLVVRPGLTSPGTLWTETHGDGLLDGVDPETSYAERQLPVKLALDLAYVARASLRYDVALVWRTLAVVGGRLVGRREFPDPPELARAHGLAAPARVRPTRQRASATLVLATCLGFACHEHRTIVDPEPDEPAVLAAAGNIATCGTEFDEATANLLDGIDGLVIPLGDNAFPSGTLSAYRDCYGPSWGRHLDRTRAVLGNHEYDMGAAEGAFDYFGDRAGPRGLGYYSFDTGAWHIIALNDQGTHVPFAAGSAQDHWLVSDLAANEKRCILAMWHEPRFLSATGFFERPSRKILWDRLYAAGADIVLNGQEHWYERMAPMDANGNRDDANGIRQFNVGTGGESLTPPDTAVHPSSEVRGRAFGVLELTLLSRGYDWRFIPIDGESFTDSGSGTCHGAATS